VKSITSDNACGGTYFWTWGSGVNVRADAYLSSPVVAQLAGPTYVKVICQKQGGPRRGVLEQLVVQNGVPVRLHHQHYIDHPAAILPGVPTC
jgi:hypothetical protein